jgi:hypothetical protein
MDPIAKTEYHWEIPAQLYPVPAETGATGKIKALLRG